MSAEPETITRVYRDVLIERLTEDLSEGKYRVVYREGMDEWPYAYESLEDAWRGIENWLAGRNVEDDER